MNCEEIIEENSKMIWKIANHFYGVDKDDLYQAGVVGLLKALKNYNHNTNVKFSTYAYEYIFGEMFLLASNKEIKISKDILLLTKKIEEARFVLAQKLCKIPSNLELSEFLNIDLETIEFALMSASTIISLDQDNDEDKDAYEKFGKEYDMFTKVLIDDSLEVLSEDEKDIIKSRYFEDLTQEETARKLKMTQVKVSRYEKKGINKMRNYLTL